MNVKTKIILFSAIIFLSVNVFAQNFRYSPWKNLTTDSNSPDYKIPGKLYVFNSILNGSVYLYEIWKQGSIILENGATYDSLMLKLNTLQGELIMYNELSGANIEIDKEAVKEFTIVDEYGNIELFRKVFSDQIPAGNKYVNILYEGKIKLFLWHKTKELLTIPYLNRSGLTQNSEFYTTKIYYLDLPGQGIVRFNPKLSSVIELFPEQKKTIKRLHRKEHLSYKENTEIIRAIKSIETNILN
jgi:hypothetical protein